MKLKFNKIEDGTITVSSVHGDVETDFNYIEMIEYLYENNLLQDMEYCEEITEDEKIKLTEMISKINAAIVRKENADMNVQVEAEDIVEAG
ncbi:hypothetical protein [Serpentinicella alkaliphila]|uniref:Uncharacterized protein n=1 Tax=Serpentinicella alkaliphila TaxID=1734049 RepID=A0A4R2SXR7_9FIRM|nr:hypothetical protein [Serpentinicella alkaliphila]QUH26138.1 hypothetical protein HZR23_10585 [Serpentinicella alkaliphila]TCP93446.1 hypothetical protein EDD79_10771 [Serpentinicella alkaliphila]